MPGRTFSSGRFLAIHTHHGSAEDVRSLDLIQGPKYVGLWGISRRLDGTRLDDAWMDGVMRNMLDVLIHCEAMVFYSDYPLALSALHSQMGRMNRDTPDQRRGAIKIVKSSAERRTALEAYAKDGADMQRIDVICRKVDDFLKEAAAAVAKSAAPASVTPSVPVPSRFSRRLPSSSVFLSLPRPVEHRSAGFCYEEVFLNRGLSRLTKILFFGSLESGSFIRGRYCSGLWNGGGPFGSIPQPGTPLAKKRPELWRGQCLSMNLSSEMP